MRFILRWYMNPQTLQKALNSRYNIFAQLGAIRGMNQNQAELYRGQVDKLVPQADFGNVPVASGLAEGFANAIPNAVSGMARLPAAQDPREVAWDLLNIGTGAIQGAEGLHAVKSALPAIINSGERGGALVGKSPSLKQDVNAAYNSGNLTAQEAKMGFGVRPLAKESIDPITLHPDYFAGHSLQRGADVIEKMQGDSIYKLWKAGEADNIPGIGEGIVRRLDLIFKNGRLSNANVAQAIRDNIPAESAITPKDIAQGAQYTRWPTLNMPGEEQATNMWVNAAAKARAAGESIPPQVMKNLPLNWMKLAVNLGYALKSLR